MGETDGERVVRPRVKPELLAPAGNMEKLKVAIRYGADAVYLGGKAFGLRNLAGNFTRIELDEAVAYAHRHGVKVYLTVNAFADNEDLPVLERYLAEVAGIPFDAFIAADPGVVALIAERYPERDIHLSTQANTTNWRSARFWQAQGVKRVNLAREMSLDAIRETAQRCDMELEVFIHGAMCISYSGRCLLSSAMTGRDANKGECTQPCRWNYSIVEETRPGEYFPIHEDESGTFIFNSKDLCLIEQLPALVECGVDSLKIEGRMKGIYYAASVIRIYREALDRYWEDPLGYRLKPEWLEELAKVSHRGYTTGFLLGKPRDVDHEYLSTYVRNFEFVALVEKGVPGGAQVMVRNRLQAGDVLELIGQGAQFTRFTLSAMTDLDGVPLTVAHPNQQVILAGVEGAGQFDLIRREKLG
ncbi:peptidase U32 family protein [Geomonas subterranea]|uniref:U32 family peptidase n=1 Tax=Geomonas subterranea TaxID=2847989 RepID=A0ABX8LMY0_9BACT|nr:MULTISPECIES: U32 family peptidase [Geomonas]QXE93043.1 U32 family peptidase [Geomonas subterranea]QXM11730.1 U32 family peptidase [Geomonas subterranea]